MAAFSISDLHTELWTSWASLLRSYAAAHGLHAPQHAVIEVSAREITFRVGPRWLRCTPTALERGNAPPMTFRLNENGTASLNGGAEEEMDLLAERLAREMMHELPQ